MKRDIAIVGAGIGGLAAAAGLARAGHRVRVFDRFDRPRPVGSGLVIQPVGQAVLHALGALPEAEVHGARIHRMFGHEAERGRPVLDVTYDAPGQPRHGLAIHRAALFQALYAQAEAAEVEIHPNAPCTGRSGQTLTFDTGTKGPFDLIVDASGAGSRLSPLRARPLAYGALWATVPWPDGSDLPRNVLRQVYRRADRMVGVLPLGKRPGDGVFQAAVFWSLARGSHPTWRRAGLAAWREEAAGLWPEFGPFANAITAPEDMIHATYSHGTLARPAAQGIVHIGDAAHRASPQLGQGANMALLDAHALTLALKQARGDIALALDWYVKARRWHVRLYQLMSRLFTPQYQSDSRVLPVVRDRLLYPVSQLSPVQGLLTRLVGGDLLPPLGSLSPDGTGR